MSVNQDYAFRFTYPVTEAALKKTMRSLEEWILSFNQFGHNTSDQAAHLLLLTCTMGKEPAPPSLSPLQTKWAIQTLISP